MKKNNFKLDFIGIGAAKCATTWVYKCLLEHPQVCGPSIKELGFFLTKKQPFEKDFEYEQGIFKFNKGISFYEKYFNKCDPRKKKGEFSVFYLDDPNTAKLISEYFPDIKIIVCLRDPVKRAYSLYWYLKKFRAREKSKSFEIAIKRHPDVYINSGKYYNLLQPYVELFPRENIGIFIVDDLKKDAVKFIQNIYDFIGVNNEYMPQSVLKKENASKETRSMIMRQYLDFIISAISQFLKKNRMYFIVNWLRSIGLERAIQIFNHKVNTRFVKNKPINKNTERKFREFFLDDIERLEELLGRKLDSWK